MKTKPILIHFVVFGFLIGYSASASGQMQSPSSGAAPRDATSDTISLPTDRLIDVDSADPPQRPIVSSLPTLAESANSPWRRMDFKSLLRPRVALSSEFEPQVSGVRISSHDLSIQLPVYPIFGPPPPFINFGYSFTRLDAPSSLDLPSSLNEFSLGLTWMRRINQKWMARLMVNGAFASDLLNTGSDAWQIRAGAFALYRPSPKWSFALGALATGRDDIPVIPAVGAIWQPSSELKINLMLPKPRISFLLADFGQRQHWGYVGGGISGGTWAYNRDSGSGDRLTYREWRLVLGWESTPPQMPGSFRPQGLNVSAEIGYAFGREFEFDRNFPDISVRDALLLRVGLRF